MIVNCARAIAGTICILMSLTDERDGASARLDFDSLIEQHYRSLYQFAFSLTQSESDACDLTQQTFYIWATKGHQLRDLSKVKTWLFTTLHREFLQMSRLLSHCCELSVAARRREPLAASFD